VDHSDARRLMARAFETPLTQDMERDLALHLVGCAECKVLYEGLQHAHPALSSLAPGSPPGDAIERAIERAITVLRGEADPGPVARNAPPEAPPIEALPDNYQAGPVVIQPAETKAEELLPLDEVEWEESPGAVRPVEADRQPIEPPPGATEDVVAPPVDAPAALEAPSAPDEDVDLAPELPPVEEELIQIPARPEVRPEMPRFEDPVPARVQPRSEIDELLDEERRRLEPLPYVEEELAGEGPRPSTWFLAVAAVVALFVITFFIITRGPNLFGGGQGDLPKPDEVKNGVERAFKDMRSLKADFSIERLGLYRIGTKDKAAVYSFSNGRYTGKLTYDRAEGYRQQFTLEARGNELTRANIVQSADETQSIIGRGSQASYIVEKLPPLGPPDGAFRPSLGLLEDAIGSVAGLMAGASDLKVVGKSQNDTRDLYEVRFSVRATELSRADQMDVFFDSQTFLPVKISRSISRDNAQVLGPSSALTSDVLDRAFGSNARVTTEVTELSNIVKDDIILPGDFAVNPPTGVKEQESDSHFERVTRASLSKLDFKPLFPSPVPSGFEEQQLTVFRGTPPKWGPQGTYPAPSNIFQVSYFDGKTTIVVTERQLSKPFDLGGRSPLRGGTLPITVRTVERDGDTFYFGTSPEVPPHAFGFIGNTFVMASGYAPQARLIGVLTSLQEASAEVPAPIELSPSPGATGSTSPSPSSATLPAG
jgi:hypothetical protein